MAQVVVESVVVAFVAYVASVASVAFVVAAGVVAAAVFVMGVGRPG